jgi:probable HAF family extracellular repeat protein
MLPRQLKQFAFFIASFCLCTAAHASPIYNFTTLAGPYGNGDSANANGISNSGVVVGDGSYFAGTTVLNFLYKPDHTYAVLTGFGLNFGMANGVNSAGIVVGVLNNQAVSFNTTNGDLTYLPAAQPGSSIQSQAAFGINDHNTIVGQFQNLNGTETGFLDAGGVFTDLSPAVNAVFTNAQAINNNGIVAGYYTIPNGDEHGFLYNSNTGQYTLLPDPQVPGLQQVEFLGINDDGIAVGYYQADDGSQHGFLYDIATQTYTFLDDPSEGAFASTEITGINNSGEISGIYTTAAGNQEGFVADPVASPVPEPASLALTGLGLFLLAAFHRKHPILG